MELAVMHGVARVQVKGHNEQRTSDLRRPTRRGLDWVAQLEVLAQHPRAAGMAPIAREPGDAPMDTATLRERIATERRAAVARSRMN